LVLVVVCLEPIRRIKNEFGQPVDWFLIVVVEPQAKQADPQARTTD